MRKELSVLGVGLVGKTGVILACVLFLCAQAVSAQQISGIAGLVRDTSGGVLPGVTVEAESPALIERVRTASTDGSGRYNIQNLRPGTYTVTFSLPGFTSVRREGIQLTAGFTAPVNADLEVGTLEETVTVTGASPVVDVQNVNQQEVVSRETFRALPSGQMTMSSIARLVPGMVGSGMDVGGAIGMYSSNTISGAEVHGKRAAKMSYDGMQTEGLAFFGYMAYIMNPSSVDEFVVDQGGSSAESDVSGLRLNLIPKEGGNVFSGDVTGMFSTRNLHRTNLTSTMESRGLKTTGRIHHMFDLHTVLGGPFVQDKLWFLVTTRFASTKKQNPGLYFNKSQGTSNWPQYVPDLNKPAYGLDTLRSVGGRVTWQASPRNKVNAFGDFQELEIRGGLGRGPRAPEASDAQNLAPNGVYQATWTSPVTNRLLFEAGVSFADVGTSYHFGNTTDKFGFTVKPTDTNITEATTGLGYNAKDRYRYSSNANRFSERLSLTYVTGSHAFKTGVTMQQHVLTQDTTISNDRTYRFVNGKPSRITLWAQPFVHDIRTPMELGLYAQDKWTIDRLTINYGLRFDYFNGYVKPIELGAGQFVDARSFPEVTCAPCWSDLNPRMGLSYDLFGDGRTALKMSYGRYLGKHATTVGQLLSPVSSSVAFASRSWTDTDGDYEPDCDLRNNASNGECGPISNKNFGKLNPNAQTFDEDVLKGFAKREMYWDFTAEIQHQLSDTVAMSVSYNRNWSGYFGATGVFAGGPFGLGTATRDNLAITGADFDEYCITGPVDSRLPGGGAQRICGLWDQNPAKYGQGIFAIRRPMHFKNINGGTGKNTTSDFLTLTVDARGAGGLEAGGSLDTGRTLTDNCFVVDSPQQLLYCRFTKPFVGQLQVKGYAIMPLPGGIDVSFVYQGLPGVTYGANITVRNNAIAPSLGRNLAACGARTVCNASVRVPLLEPWSEFEPRLNLFDVRLSKTLSLGAGGRRLRVNLDVYNLFNDGAATTVNSNFGSSWRRGNRLIPGALIQVGGELTF